MFSKYFSIDEANRTLPLVKRILDDIKGRFEQFQELRIEYERLDKGDNSAQAGELRDRLEEIADDLNDLIGEFEPVGCQLKDPQIGLIDFPARHEEREILLCWKLGEPDVQFWHELDAGFAGRRPIAELTVGGSVVESS